MRAQSLSSQQGEETALVMSLSILDQNQPNSFIKPVKKINEGHDVQAFVTSRAYTDIGTFFMQLNIAMCPRKASDTTQVQTWALDSPMSLPEPIRKLQELLQCIDAIIEEAPPDTGPRRFGNVSFRKWYEILESRVKGLLETHLPEGVLHFGNRGDGVTVLDELTPYLMGGFGSAQRLDYGTGHELSFLAFLGCIWKLGGFSRAPSQDGSLERNIVIGIVEPYLKVVRRLILTYTLEPAGSHGVWGLDDHSFIPYILGSSQYCPAIAHGEAMPVEGSLPRAPNPGDVAKKSVVDKEKRRNMYFSAVGFINDVKTGPFWEHSPILFDISGIRSGWGKINKGMIKMYNAEVLSKFPVVQHFLFGSLFRWEQDPNAAPATQAFHTASHPVNQSIGSNIPTARPPPAGMAPSAAPWAKPSSNIPQTGVPPAVAPWAKRPSNDAQTVMPPMKAPWASNNPPGMTGRVPIRAASHNMPGGSTRASKEDQGGSERR